MTLALHGKSRTRRTWLLAAALLAVIVGIGGSLMLNRTDTRADSTTIDFESPYTPGNIHGQQGWSKTGPYDVEVVADGGNQALRISNGTTSGSFGDQTFSKSLTQEAGETHATNGGMSGGARQNHFEVSWDIKSVQAAQQPGLAISFSPDRGDGGRMSYLSVVDDTNGLDVTFFDVQQPGPCTPSGCANFVPTQVANDLDRTVYHNLKLVMDFNDGPANDIVRVYIDGILVHTGTSWEDYFRYDPEASADQHTHTVDSLLLRAGGAAAATTGFGYLVDNLSLSSSTVPAPAPLTTVVQAGTLTAPGGGGWLFWDDNTNTFNNTPGVLGSFVTGPATQPLGTGSAEITDPGAGRTALATYQYAGTPLESITQLGWSAFNGSASAPVYLNFNVDFNLTDVWQSRLVYLPTGVTPGAWQDFDAIQNGTALWNYSGANWPAPNAGPGGPGGLAKTWNQILADYPNARIRVSDPHVGLRTGHPGPAKTDNIDKFIFGTDLAVDWFDFEPTVPCTTVCYVNATTGNDAYDGATAVTAKKTIQAAMDGIAPNGTIHVAPGTYNESVSFTQSGVQLLGAGVDQSIISSPVGGADKTVSVVGLSNELIDGFTITRDGNTVPLWPTADTYAVAFGTGGSGNTIQNSKMTGHRTGVYIEGTTGTVVQNNVIDFNRTGIHMVDNVSATNIHNNFITNNWTSGVLLRSTNPTTDYGSTGILINNNDISGNWYVDLEVRAVSANGINAENNWYGTVTPSVVNQDGAGEPGYTSQIPVAYGGSAVPSSNPPDIIWNGQPSFNVSNPIDFTPFLCSGNDTSTAIGFQPQIGCGDIIVTSNSANIGDTVTVQVIANNVVNLYGVQAFLQYDSSKMNLSNVTLGTGLQPEFNVSMSQPGNQINFGYTQQAPTLPVSGSGIVLATLQFTATGPGIAAVEFRSTPQTLFSDNNGFSIGPATKTDGAITIGALSATGTVTGDILLQGRSNHSGATAQVDPTGGPISGPTSSTGAFTINSVGLGAHTIQAVMIGYLKAVKPLIVASGSNPAGTVTLKGGDANMDNTINIADLSFIAARYLQSGPVYAPVAPVGTTPDINGDNVVNIQDLSLTASNYLQTTQLWP